MTHQSRRKSGGRVVWLSWLDHQRTRGIADKLGHEVKVWETTRRGALRYAGLGIRTTAWLWKAKPERVIVQCPSIVLALLALALLLLRNRVVIDAHNEIVQNYNYPDSRVISFAYKLVLRKADATIVTNPTLARMVTSVGGRPIVLPDAIVLRHDVVRKYARRPMEIAVVATYAKDEPIHEIIEAARQLGPDFRFRMTGKLGPRAFKLTSGKPDNIELTGFLSHGDYWGLLDGSDAVLDLTLKPACLVCGAYEAISLRRPVILSDDAENRLWFGGAATYTANTAVGIAETLRGLRDSYPQFVAQQQDAIDDLARRWDVHAIQLSEALAA